MTPRTAEDRQRAIVRTARATGSVDVAALAVELGVARETVRRDLRTLEDHGLVRRTHGGAYPVESAGFETTLAFRATSHVPEKRRIAAAAARLLGDAETVFVDEGFTPQLIAGALPRDRPLTVVTASLPVAGALAEAENMSVLLLGGRVRSGTLATVDHWTTKMLGRLRRRPRLPRRQRHLPRARPDHPGPGRRRGQGAGRAGGAPRGVRGRAHQVRRGRLLPVRRGGRAGDDRDEHPASDGRGPSVLTAGTTDHQGLKNQLTHHGAPPYGTPMPHHARYVPLCPGAIHANPEPTEAASHARRGRRRDAARPAALRLLGRGRMGRVPAATPSTS